jgi:hypothetical protein
LYVPSFRSNIDGMTRPAWIEAPPDCVARMRGDQIPVDFVSEQRVDMLIADRLIGAIENSVAEARMRGISLMPRSGTNRTPAALALVSA